MPPDRETIFHPPTDADHAIAAVRRKVELQQQVAEIKAAESIASPTVKPPCPRFVVELEALPHEWDHDGTRRMKRLLKAALRGYGMKCVSIGPPMPIASDSSFTADDQRTMTGGTTL